MSHKCCAGRMCSHWRGRIHCAASPLYLPSAPELRRVRVGCPCACYVERWTKCAPRIMRFCIAANVMERTTIPSNMSRFSMRGKARSSLSSRPSGTRPRPGGSLRDLRWCAGLPNPGLDDGVASIGKGFRSPNIEGAPKSMWRHWKHVTGDECGFSAKKRRCPVSPQQATLRHRELRGVGL